MRYTKSVNGGSGLVWRVTVASLKIHNFEFGLRLARVCEHVHGFVAGLAAVASVFNFNQAAPRILHVQHLESIVIP